jgi:two-component system sensor histidine kinase/response regulator
VINDIPAFSKIAAGKVDLEDVDFHLRDCLENTLKLLALPPDEKGLELRREVRALWPCACGCRSSTGLRPRR